MLVTVYFQVDGKVTKAIIDEKYRDFFKGLGAVDTPYEAKKEAHAVKEIKSRPVEKQNLKPVFNRDNNISRGDIGTGKPGSALFHESCLNEIRSFDAIAKYTKDVTGELPKKTGRSTISSYRKSAIKLIRKFIEDGSQSG